MCVLLPIYEEESIYSITNFNIFTQIFMNLIARIFRLLSDKWIDYYYYFY